MELSLSYIFYVALFLTPEDGPKNYACVMAHQTRRADGLAVLPNKF